MARRTSDYSEIKIRLQFALDSVPPKPAAISRLCAPCVPTGLLKYARSAASIDKRCASQAFILLALASTQARYSAIDI